MKTYRIIGIIMLVAFPAIHPPGSSSGSLCASGMPLSAAIVPFLADPSLTWQSFLGGTGYDEAYGVAADPSGNVYVVGRSQKNWGMPIKRYNGGIGDAFVAKLSSGGALLWNTFLGSSADDFALGVAAYADGVYVSGVSAKSWGKPLRPYSGKYDAFVANLSADGALRWNTFLGSSGLDGATGIACDSTGNAYVTGATSFTWGTPVREFAWGGISDAFVARLSTSGTLAWNTFLGSSDYDAGLGLALDGAGNVFAAGISKAGWGSPVGAYSGGDDAFVAKLNGTNGTLLWNSFLGSPGRDQAVGIASDSEGNVVVVGRGNASWGKPLRAHNGNMNSFAAKLDGSGKLAWNTFLGIGTSGRPAGKASSPFTNRGENFEAAVGVVLDGSGNVFVSGTSRDTWGSPARAHGEVGEDGYLAKLDSSGALQWHSFLGKSNSTSVRIASDGKGGIYVAGRAYDYNVRTLASDAYVARFTTTFTSSP